VRQPRAALAVQTLTVAAITGRLIAWCLPALREVKSHDSPPVQAMKWVRQNIPVGSTLFIDGAFAPHAGYYLKSYDAHFVDGEEGVTKMPPMRNAWYVADHSSTSTSAVNFRRRRKKLYAISRRRCFESSVCPLLGTIRFLDGWHEEKSRAAETLRWMGRRARIALSPIAGGGELRFRATVPIDKGPPPLITIIIDGRPVDRFVASTGDFSRRYEVPPSPAAHEVVFDLSGRGDPADRGDLGMQLPAISWQP
jgi:hypothetical protein